MKLFTGKKIYDIRRGFRAVNREIIDFFTMYYPTEYPEPISRTKLLKQEKIA